MHYSTLLNRVWRNSSPEGAASADSLTHGYEQRQVEAFGLLIVAPDESLTCRKPLTKQIEAFASATVRHSMIDTTSPMKERPLSPHLSIYKPIPTMVMSILHRITGAAMYFASMLVAWWLIATAIGPGAYGPMSAFFESLFGEVGLFLLSWVLIHHMIGGIKHLVQDTGKGLGKEETTKFSYLHAVLSVALTVLLWIVGAIVN